MGRVHGRVGQPVRRGQQQQEKGATFAFSYLGVAPRVQALESPPVKCERTGGFAEGGRVGNKEKRKTSERSRGLAGFFFTWGVG